MTIKHMGGIFGRNPTFDTVVAETGIKLGGDESVNLLNEYREGSWTPGGFANNSTSITPGAGLSTGGQFTKIGNTVFGALQIDLDDPGTSVSVGDLFTFNSGLPYRSVEANVHACGEFLIYGSIGSNNLAVGQILIGASNAQYYKVIQVSGTVNYGMVIQGRFSYRMA